MLMQDLTAQIDQAKSDVEIKSETKAKKLEAKATAEGDVAIQQQHEMKTTSI